MWLLPWLTKKRLLNQLKRNIITIITITTTLGLRKKKRVMTIKKRSRKLQPTRQSYHNKLKKYARNARNVNQSLPWYQWP